MMWDRNTKHWAELACWLLATVALAASYRAGGDDTYLQRYRSLGMAFWSLAILLHEW